MSNAKLIALATQYIKNCKGFERLLDKVKIIDCGEGKCLAEYKVQEDVTNIVGAMHGGFSATLVDAISSFALYFNTDTSQIPSVSTDMHITYHKAAKLGEEIIIDANTLRAGKTMAFLTCEIRNKATGEILVKGSHTKFIFQPRNTQ